ncbi:DNA/RNA helicase domain-containing protein [Neobacillus sp. D3-1R]|uniref:DNA/RNA helicase domain-containing protein n=1 Tax=Neobacillus sp. D3-1R TaxID=3445778 RepID=UPI003F9F5DEF
MRKLYIVEGIPGSGKTTTAQWLTEVLKSRGNNVKLFLEGNHEHPADYESVACLTELQVQDLEKQFPEIHSLAEKKNGRLFIPYGHLYEKNQDLHKALQAYDVYELPVEDFYEVTLDRWQEFTNQTLSNDDIYVLECCFLQNPFTFLLAKHDVKQEIIFNHIEKISQIIAELDPVILYFEQDDIEDSVNRVRKERSKEWFDSVTCYYTEQAYGQARDLKGEKGVFHFLKERKQLEKEILSQLSIKSILLNNSEYDWEKRKEEILSVIK